MQMRFATLCPLFIFFSILFIFSTSVFALPTYQDKHTFNYTVPVDSYSFALKGVKKHTAYNYERVARVCVDSRGREYTCYQNVPVPVEVRDYFILGEIEMMLGPAAQELGPNQEVAVSLNEMNIKVEVRGTEALVAYGEVLDYQVLSDRRPTKKFRVLYQVSFGRLSEHLNPVSAPLSEMSYRDYSLTFKVNRVDFPESFVPGLKIVQKKLFSSQVIDDRDLYPSEYELLEMGDKTQVTVDLSRYKNYFTKGGSFELTARSQIKFKHPKIISVTPQTNLSKTASIAVKF
ncbi:MAG: hypothetical protein A2504_10830 [Bdellovibrionales bacterium RIFOXYD12_FULL_39_22]|nr:MAG: hypothetical protein A2385_09395 [Bdellovibrionales bacterium RIFOXYB1_FULL_39_21]OFZ44174.1 MAG: hypothetical protein A2485_07015 [Bdellovibrionales bacterium RIFOXYC12_FULL_39_17]OFZ46716.1 MAG: hypothetical protein A2404_04250 [Bdellovibrionales bacterium RIFOXYC1_FULL_39_130]OFZ68244.1 MAG: hypothetical protein A2451_13935 [Bdellovibrionales bacterium RIFOXYC2_FULL_39_8]OFZ76007.1 MAG: hypothetical protein A2560_02900 [Bdellovibrionales bacterium RIFOXYD1_FULL_39_84]OFZ95396.1 MAG: